MAHRKFLSFSCALALLFVSLLITHAAAGGELSGTVTDIKGALVTGALVAVADPATQKTLATTTTDGQGRFKITNLPAGVYHVTITAKGFTEFTRDQITITDGQSVNLDAHLEVASVNAGSVTVTATGARAGTDPVYRQLRQQASTIEDFSGAYATVNNLVLRRDVAQFTLRSGELYFLSPVEGRIVGAVFIGEGEFSLTPPTEVERHSLAYFTEQPSITEQFSKLTLRFTDKTFEEIKSSSNARMGTAGAQAAHAREIYRSNQTLLRKELRTNMELRTLVDVYTPERPGFFVAFIGGKRFNKLIFQLDPLGIPEVSPEEVLLASYGETDGGFWTAFHLADEYRRGTAASSEDHRIYDIAHHDIDGAIRGTKIAAVDRLTLRPLIAGTRVLPFNLFHTLRVSRVQDEQGRDLDFIQEGKDEDAELAVIWPEAMEAGKSYKLIVEYVGGDAITDVGGGNFFVYPGARETWYPNNSGTQFGDRATFDMTFHYPKNKMLIGTGERVGQEAHDGDLTVAKWTSGTTELAVAGFNYGLFKKKEVDDKVSGYNIEFYANEELPSFMRGAEGVGSMSTTGMADSALADAQNSARIYNAYFGKLPYTRFAMTQQPAANFGQAWPTLVYMPFTAFMDSTQRYLATGSARFATDNFFRYVGPHEIAHQWWGHMVGWDSYHDQWMSEGFAEFSASLYVQYVRRDMSKFIDFWDAQRDLITQSRPQTKDRKPYTVGPVTQGYRLNSGKTGNIARFLIYPKGAYILHMLRMMMRDGVGGEGDKQFMAMMQDFIKLHYNKDVSTEDLKATVERHLTPKMDLTHDGRMDWFFNEWVYGTEIPSYKFEYQINGNTLSGRMTQSNVSDNFRMLVPVYVDFGKGWTRIGTAPMTGNSSVDLTNITLPQPPKRAAIAALNDVLALNIENIKR